MDKYAPLSMAIQIFSTFLSNSPSKKTWNEIKEQSLLKEWFIHSENKGESQGKSLWIQSHEMESYEDLASDFTSLFICDEECLKAPPYGSYYLDKDGETYTKESDDVFAIYQQFSFKTELMKTEPSDHIAIELEFLALLLNSYGSNKSFEKTLKIFLNVHIAPWVFIWCKDIQKNAQSSFYRGLSYLLPSCIEILMHTLNIPLETRIIHRTAS